MRVRTEKKREEIIQMAAELFDALGYERTTMSAIATRLGGSKATLYGYFESKEDLLRAVLDRDVNEEADRLMQELLSEKDLRSGLIRLGIAYLSGQPSRTASIRTVVNQPIAQDFYENVLQPAWQRLADRFATMMKEGRLKFADPWIAAMHWKGLNEWDMLEKYLLCARIGDDANDIVSAATAAADAFLEVYASPPEASRVPE
ncbi:TetR/AcrR family transcriptional regulator [Sphingomonas sp. JC676]|uniref:TetR/AcrR family transcriptional regulator n=1 Tax=Sphingomonas sp. JC676 TaxID=2768065 RepID=UPI0016586F9C|nr:TetR/AcrR family transcriptional regulator [Sphingomonas sp. JC676]MBC9032480.1 TetR/AcrR family transcriptional regulator [Sphingomonas sp. JC676]